MQLYPLPADEDAVRRYVEELWLPYHRDLSAVVGYHELADDDEIDVVAEETEFRLDLLESDTHRIWVAAEVDGGEDEDEDEAAAEVDGDQEPDDLDFHDLGPDVTLAGYVTTDIDECPTVFDYPDRLVVGDIYVKEPYRGTGLARTLVERAAWRAREDGCPEVRLDVDVDNERARAFYEKLGFEPLREQLVVDADEL